MNSDKNIFRLAAILYSTDDYNSNRDNIIKKILESIFIEDNRKKNVFTLIEIIKDNYSLDFLVEEIEEVLEKNKLHFQSKRAHSGEYLEYCLTEKRFKTHSSKTYNDISIYIDKYIDSLPVEIDKTLSKETVHKFIYEIFTTNHDTYEYFLNNKNINNPFSLNQQKYSNVEKEIINGFLNFEDEEKDKAIFSIVSLYLEYCILTSHDKQIYTSKRLPCNPITIPN